MQEATMPARRYVPYLTALLATAGAVGACLTGEIVDLGRNVDGGAAALVTDGLDATLLPEGGMPVFIPVVSASTKGPICRGACVELVASASGAPGPFTYSWGQGLGEGAGPKTVCPSATAAYSVTVYSTSSDQQSTGTAMIAVVDCDSGTAPAPAPQDAGGPAPPAPDSGSSPPPPTLCISNPSFEGAAPTIGSSIPPGIPPTAAPPQWQVCLGDPDIDPSVSLLPASDQKTYVGLSVGIGTFSNMTESLGTTLCAPMQAGTRYSFCIDLAIGIQGVTSVAPPLGSPMPAGSPMPSLQIWGGRAPCSQDELLWSTTISNRDAWARVCGTLTPSQTFSNISLVPALGASTTGPGTWSYVIADHIVQGP